MAHAAFANAHASGINVGYGQCGCYTRWAVPTAPGPCRRLGVSFRITRPCPLSARKGPCMFASEFRLMSREDLLSSYPQITQLRMRWRQLDGWRLPVGYHVFVYQRDFVRFLLAAPVSRKAAANRYCGVPRPPLHYRPAATFNRAVPSIKVQHE